MSATIQSGEFGSGRWEEGYRITIEIWNENKCSGVHMIFDELIGRKDRNELC